MSRRCKKLREKALRDGAESPAAAVWRIHSKSCLECQTEQFLLRALERQGDSQKQHLGREDVAQLLESAREQHRRRRRARPIKRWACRAASVALLFGVALHLSRNERVRDVAEGPSFQLLAQSADDDAGNYGIPLSPAHQEHERTVEQMATDPAAPVPMPASMPGFFLRDRLMDIREDMDTRREELLYMQQRDLGDWGRDETWHVVFPTYLAVV